MNHTLLHQIALTLIPGIGCVQARNLLQHFTAEEIFKARSSTLEKIEGLGEVRVRKIKKFTDFSIAEKEISFIEKHKITPLFIKDEAYPKRLLHCYDAPIMLYYRGNAHLNHPRIIAVVGTRLPTEYGQRVTEELIKDLADSDVLIVSGLAYGVDSIAHKSALHYNIPTLGVLAHGMDKIYPGSHKNLAKEMIGKGGLITEFLTETKPDRHHFPSRNRLVAGMSDATIVIETDIKGGSMITAELANDYNKDVFAYPGKITDKKSYGCNYLIKNNKAILLTDATQLIDTMGWSEDAKPAKKKPRELFITLTEHEKIIFDLLNARGPLGIDEIHFQSGLNSSAIAVAILNLELQQIIQSLPGKMYHVV